MLGEVGNEKAELVASEAGMQLACALRPFLNQDVLRSVDGLSGEKIDHNVVRVGTTEPEPVQPLIDALRARGAVIRSVKPVRPSLEDLFSRLQKRATESADELVRSFADEYQSQTDESGSDVPS